MALLSSLSAAHAASQLVDLAAPDCAATPSQIDAALSLAHVPLRPALAPDDATRPCVRATHRTGRSCWSMFPTSDR